MNDHSSGSTIRASAIVDRGNELERGGAIARRGHFTRKAGVLVEDARSALRIYQLNPGRADAQLDKARRLAKEAQGMLAFAPDTPTARKHARSLDDLRAEIERVGMLTLDELRAENDANRPEPHWRKFRRSEETR